MKKCFLIMLSALLLLAAGCGKRVTGSSSGTPDLHEVQTADGKNYDNSVRFVDGELRGSSFNWDYFVTKADAGYAGDVKLVVTEGGADKIYEISYSGGSFSVSVDGALGIYSRLARFEAALPAGSGHSSVTLGILTDK